MLFEVHETRRESVRLLDYLAAACIAGAGYLHYCLYLKGYRAIPTIGTGFLFQFLGSGIVAVALVIPFELRVQARRIAVSTRIGARLAGIALSAGTLVAFVLSRLPGGLFNFQERGLQPAPQSLLTILTEGAAVLLLVTSLVLDAVRGPASTAKLPLGHAARRHRASV